MLFHKLNLTELLLHVEMQLDIKLNTTVMPFIIRGVKLWGIDSVMISKKRREFIWSQVSELVDFKLLEKILKPLV